LRPSFVAVLILIRHAQSSANLQGLLVGRMDVPLTDLGRAQARALDGAVHDVVTVLTSPLQRATQTATLAFPSITPVVDDAFIEQDYGTLDGTEISQVPPELWRQFRNDHDAALGGGESLAQVDARVHHRLEEWAASADSLLRDPHQHVVVVSHVTPVKSAVAWALGVPGSVAWRLRLDNATLTTIGLRDGAGYLVGFNQRPGVAP
jgi:broad specificity phosphatase PhoE